VKKERDLALERLGAMCGIVEQIMDNYGGIRFINRKLVVKLTAMLAEAREAVTDYRQKTKKKTFLFWRKRDEKHN
jgi:hypothetical protein